MSEFQHTLERLARTFDARDIMVPKSSLKCVRDRSSAEELLKKYPNYDVIPIEQKGNLIAYMERGAEHSDVIRIQDVVSDSTSILELVDTLRKRKFCFVLVGQRVDGYIHFSDLNNQIVKLSFFVLLEALEQDIVAEIGSLICEDNLEKVLDSQRIDKVRGDMSHRRKHRSDLSWANLLYFKELILFADHFGKVHLKGNEVDAVSKVRTLVCHASLPLVESHQDVARLSEAKRICLQHFNSLAMSANRSS